MNVTCRFPRTLLYGISYLDVLSPPEGIPRPIKWWGLRGPMILRGMIDGIIATGRVFHARQNKGDDSDEKRYSGPPGWWLGVGLTSPPHKKCVLLKNI